jgi:hypothetical protein
MIVQVEANVVAAYDLKRYMQHRVVFDRLIKAFGPTGLDVNLEIMLYPSAFDALCFLSVMKLIDAFRFHLFYDLLVVDFKLIRIKRTKNPCLADK